MTRPSHYGKWGQRGKLRVPEAPKGICRYCGDPVPPKCGFRSYCCADCRTAVWLRISWTTMRRHIIERDELCQLCGGLSYKSIGLRSTLDRINARYTAIEIEWSVDHITPIADGGTDDPNNLRLLCGRCHKRITKEWHGERAAQRRAAKPHTLEMAL